MHHLKTSRKSEIGKLDASFLEGGISLRWCQDSMVTLTAFYFHWKYVFYCLHSLLQSFFFMHLPLIPPLPGKGGISTKVCSSITSH